MIWAVFLCEMIEKARKERNSTQEELGKLIGVQKAHTEYAPSHVK